MDDGNKGWAILKFKQNIQSAARPYHKLEVFTPFLNASIQKWGKNLGDVTSSDKHALFWEPFLEIIHCAAVKTVSDW